MHLCYQMDYDSEKIDDYLAKFQTKDKYKGIEAYDWQSTTTRTEKFAKRQKLQEEEERERRERRRRRTEQEQQRKKKAQQARRQEEEKLRKEEERVREEQQKLEQEAAHELSGNEADQETTPGAEQNERVEKEEVNEAATSHVEQVLEDPTPVEEVKTAQH